MLKLVSECIENLDSHWILSTWPNELGLDRWPPSLANFFGGEVAGPLLHLLEEDDLKQSDMTPLLRRSFFHGRDLLQYCEYRPELMSQIRQKIYRKSLEKSGQSPRERLSSPYFIFWTNSDIQRWVIELAKYLDLSVNFPVEHRACFALHGPFLLDSQLKIGQLTSGLVSDNNTKLSKPERRKIAKFAQELRKEMHDCMDSESYEYANPTHDIANQEMNQQQAYTKDGEVLGNVLVAGRERSAEQDLAAKMDLDLRLFDTLSDDELGISDVVRSPDYLEAETVQFLSNGRACARYVSFILDSFYRELRRARRPI